MCVHVHVYLHSQAHLTLCEALDCSPPASSVHGFSQQEYCHGLPGPPPGDLPNPRIKPMFLVSPALQVDSLPTEQSGKPFKGSYREL